MKTSITEKGKFHIVDISGDVENDVEARELIGKITKLASGEAKNFCFNMENATYLNSSGISIFIHALSEVERCGGRVYMVVSDPRVRNVVELAGLDKLVQTFSSLQDFEKEHLGA